MKLTKRPVIAALVLATSSMVAVSGCSSSGTSSDPASSKAPAASATAAPPAAASGTLTVWVDDTRAPALKPIAEQFQNDTGVQVKLVVKDFANVDKDFISQVPTGKGPDVIVSPHDKLGSYVQNGVVSPLELGDKVNDYAKVAIQAVTYDGKIYGLPYSIENVALLRNTALAPKPAKDFNDVIATGQKLVKDGKAKYPFLLGLDPKQGDPYHLYPLQTSFGSAVFEQNADGSYDPNKLTLGNADGIKFATALEKWGKEGVLNANITGDIAIDQFGKGKSPYYLTGPWNLPAIKKAGMKYAIDPLPSAGGQPAKPFLGVNAFFISSKSQNKIAATKFLVDYLGTDAAQKKLYEIGGRPPALTSAYQEVAAADPDIKSWGDIGLNGVPMPAIPQMGAVWADWGGAELQLIRGKGDPKTVWTTAAGNVQKQIDSTK